ncbi:MAG: type II toxin-antitoxin system HicA family toxin [Acidobacteria bacterium]|nr:type II toxin-antitoxin system HicA family toxin [Acidobacteriota bacterium]
MKRIDFTRHLERSGCTLLREGGNHSVYVNRGRGKASSVPRHREINNFLARKICADLDISPPKR